jgi:phosphate transport system permease protein
LDSGRTLSVHIYDLAMNVPGGETPAYTTALVLLILLLVINFVASRLARVWLRPGSVA